MVQALAGLLPEYDPFITTFGNASAYDYDDLCTRLLVLEQQLSRRSNSPSSENTHALIGSTSDISSEQRGKKRDHKGRNQRGRCNNDG